MSLPGNIKIIWNVDRDLRVKETYLKHREKGEKK